MSEKSSGLRYPFGAKANNKKKTDSAINKESGEYNMKNSEVGGQAVIEGVMMKNKEKIAIAVRNSNNEIILEKREYKSLSKKNKIFELPIIRGVLVFVESLMIGMQTLAFSAGIFEEEEEDVVKDTSEKGFFNENKESITMGATIFISVALAMGLFMILPYLISEIFNNLIESHVVMIILEGIIRLAIFIGYVAAISRMKDIQRVFMYHGAEHKVINCIESGQVLTVENAMKSSKVHKRCGTSFMLTVMIISIVFFMFIRVDAVLLRIIVRLLLIPIISGVAYEFIKYSGRSNSKIIEKLTIPGLFLQSLTTREPDESMIEVSIKSLEAVFDWKEYFSQNGIELS